MIPSVSVSIVDENIGYSKGGVVERIPNDGEDFYIITFESNQNRYIRWNMHGDDDNLDVWTPCLRSDIADWIAESPERRILELVEREPNTNYGLRRWAFTITMLDHEDATFFKLSFLTD